MKIKEGFKKRELCGEYIIVAEGAKNVNYNKMIVLNKSAAYLWDEVEGCEFSIGRLAELLVSRYGIASSVAEKDAENIVRQLEEAGITEP